MVSTRVKRYHKSLRWFGGISPGGQQPFLKRSLSTLCNKNRQEMLEVLHYFLFAVLLSSSTFSEGLTSPTARRDANSLRSERPLRFLLDVL